MYVWNTFRGHIKLQKHFRLTVWRSNIDIMIDADEKKNYAFFCCLDFAIFSAYSREKFSVKVLDVCLKHI